MALQPTNGDSTGARDWVQPQDGDQNESHIFKKLARRHIERVVLDAQLRGDHATMSESEFPVVLTRQELYVRLWKSPATKIAKSVGISDVALCKICKKHDIPKPPLGYWAKIQHGKKVPRPPLPPVSDPALEQITINPAPFTAPRVDLPPQTQSKVEAEKEQEKSIVVANRLESPHPFIERTLRSLNSASADPQGLVSPKAKQCLDVAVGKDKVDRAMRIMDALVKAIETRGLKIWVEDGEYGSTTYVEVMEEKFDLKLTEHIAKRERPLTVQEQLDHKDFPTLYSSVMYEDYPSGMLAIRIGGGRRYDRHRWSDKDGSQIERRLNKIIVWLYKEAERVKQWRREIEERDRRWAEEKRIREEEERKRQKELARVKRFLKGAGRWHKAQKLRSFVCAVEDAVRNELGTVAPKSRMGRWLNWAKGRLDAYDPVERLKRQLRLEASPPKTDDESP